MYLKWWNEVNYEQSILSRLDVLQISLIEWNYDYDSELWAPIKVVNERRLKVTAAIDRLPVRNLLFPEGHPQSLIVN